MVIDDSFGIKNKQTKKEEDKNMHIYLSVCLSVYLGVRLNVSKKKLIDLLRR